MQTFMYVSLGLIWNFLSSDKKFSVLKYLNTGDALLLGSSQH